ncbi:hypothetical protein [Streptomyces sp. NPDC018059]|uniref:hypothetical protein n=1 Tax=Streptomyces sp. NPDC018059 TaxID=3365041 RepID=UPI003797CC32
MAEVLGVGAAVRPRAQVRVQVRDGRPLVDSARAYLERLAAEGAEITEPLIKVPTGSGFTARHRDGTVIEYVEHRPTAEGW